MPKTFKDIIKENSLFPKKAMGTSFAGPIPNSELAEQDLEGSTTEKAEAPNFKEWWRHVLSANKSVNDSGQEAQEPRWGIFRTVEGVESFLSDYPTECDAQYAFDKLETNGGYTMRKMPAEAERRETK